MEPLSGDLVFQVIRYTSLKLHGQTAELPQPDSNRQVIRFTLDALLMSSAVAIQQTGKSRMASSDPVFQ